MFELLFLGIIIYFIVRKSSFGKKKIKNDFEKTKGEFEKFNFYDGYKYAQKKQQRSTMFAMKCTLIVIVLVVILMIALSIIYKTKLPIYVYAINILNVMAVCLILFAVVPKIGGKSSVEKVLEEKFDNDVCRPLLESHNYHNIVLGIANIPDVSIGLVNGDEDLITYGEVTCDEFAYRVVSYSHEEENYNSQNNTTTRTTVNTLLGNEFFLPCNTGIEDIIRIVPSITKSNGKEYIYKGISRVKMDGEEHVDIEDIQFNENFEVFSKNPHSAFYFLNSNRIEYLKQLRKNNIISMVITNQGLYIATNKRTTFFEMPMIINGMELTEEKFEKELKEFEKLIGKYKKIVEL